MCVVAWEHLRPAVEQHAIQVLLTDHHYWGGLRRTRELAAVCEAFGIALSMHSNSHLGISLAAMTHVAAAIPNLDHSCDTHYPWNSADDVIRPGVLEFKDGEVRVPTGPGLGVELDHEALDRLHRLYLESGVRTATTPVTCAASTPPTNCGCLAGEAVAKPLPGHGWTPTASA